MRPRQLLKYSSAIVVNSLIKDWRPKPFRTIDVWFLDKGFKGLVMEKRELLQVTWSWYKVVQGKAENVEE